MTVQSFQAYLLAICVTLMFSTCNNTNDSERIGDTTGVTDTEIVIGSWGPLSGPAALWGTILKGTDAYFKMINDNGGIHGRKIRFIFKDDAYDPSRTVPAVRELVQKEEIFAVAGGIGTAPCMAVMGFLKENDVPWISPNTGVTHWTWPTQSNIYTSFPLYFDEGQIMANFAIHDLEAKKVGIIYQNDDFGKSGLVGAKQELQKNNMDFVAALPVEISDTDLSSHVALLKESGAEVVLLWVLPRHAAILLGNSAVIDFNPDWVTSIVLSDMALMHDITKGAWEGVYFNYPGAVMADDELFLPYKEAFEKYYPEERWGPFAAGGFLWMEVLVEGLKRAGQDLTRESFLEAMASIENFKGLGGVTISFSEDNHLGNRALSIMRCESATEYQIVKKSIESTTEISMIERLLEKD